MTRRLVGAGLALVLLPVLVGEAFSTTTTTTSTLPPCTTAPLGCNGRVNAVWLYSNSEDIHFQLVGDPSSPSWCSGFYVVRAPNSTPAQVRINNKFYTFLVTARVSGLPVNFTCHLESGTRVADYISLPN
jgi:hypothetical protein